MSASTNRTCKFCWAVTGLSLAAVAVMAYLFIIKGNVTASDDDRTAILLSAGERDVVLAEMRGFLESVQAVTAGLAEQDMPAVASGALAVGMAEFQGVPTSLMGKLPLEFKSLGMATHEAFDDLAREAQDIGDPQVVLTKLGDLMLNCTSCHASYRLDIEVERPE